MIDKLDIKFRDSEIGDPIGYMDIYALKAEYPYVFKKLDDGGSYEKYTEAISYILNYMYTNGFESAVIDLKKRNEKLTPVKEITIEEIENELGYKIKVVKEKKND